MHIIFFSDERDTSAHLTRHTTNNTVSHNNANEKNFHIANNNGKASEEGKRREKHICLMRATRPLKKSSY